MKYIYKTISRDGHSSTATIITNNEGGWLVKNYMVNDHTMPHEKQPWDEWQPISFNN